MVLVSGETGTMSSRNVRRNPHTFEHVEEVILNFVRQKGKLMNVPYVPTITKTSCRSHRLSTKGCRSDSRTSGASLKKKGSSSHKGIGKGGCLSSKQMKSELQCLLEVKRSLDIDLWLKRFGHVNFP